MVPRVAFVCVKDPGFMHLFIRKTFGCSMKIRSNKRSSLLLFLITILFPLFGCGSEPLTDGSAKEKVIMTVAVDATLIPMSFVGDDNQLTGFEVDLIREVARGAGFGIELVNVEWAGLFGGLVTRKFDVVISSVTILEERKKRMAFSIP